MTLVTAVRFGTSGRNILRKFTITEPVSLQFREEMFGVTNTPPFAKPGTNVSDAVRNADNTIRTLSGYSEVTAAGGERRTRFALRISF